VLSEINFCGSGSKTHEGRSDYRYWQSNPDPIQSGSETLLLGTVHIFPVLRIRIQDTGSGAFLTPGSRSGIRNRFFPDPGSWISDPGSQTHIFERLVTIFWGKKFYNSLKIGPTFFYSTFQKSDTE
jgi:hypothetical protein